MRTLSLPHARRIAIAAQGLHRRRPDPGVRRDVRHLRRVLDAIHVIQLDSVNVLARAHELPFWSRLGPHDRAARDRWLWRSREAYEGWIHVASCGPIDLWPVLDFARRGFEPWPQVRQLNDEDPGYIARVLDEVAAHGPRSVQDLTDPGRRNGPWWGNPRGKDALDYLAVKGELAVDHRTSQFVTVYDLAERVVPAAVREVEPPPESQARESLLLHAARAHGLGTVADLADYHRQRIQPARAAMQRLLAAGALEEVRVKGWGDEPVYVHPEASAARRIHARTLLSPFDPLMWFRDRAERLFGFRYRIEIYVPEARRQYGYYVLPFLLGDQIAARVDLKADRQAGRLLVRAAHLEDGASREVVARELAAELAGLGAWLEVPEVVVEPKGDLAADLRRAVA